MITESDPKVSLHGGPKGFDDVDWDVIHPMEATLFSDNEKISIGSIPAAVIFRYTSPDGDQGFPGTLLIEVLVGLVNPGQNAPESAQGEYHLGSILFVYRAKLLMKDGTTIDVAVKCIRDTLRGDIRIAKVDVELLFIIHLTK